MNTRSGCHGNGQLIRYCDGCCAVLRCAAAQVVLPEGVYDVNGQQLDTR
jgi:hypothetical protein